MLSPLFECSWFFTLSWSIRGYATVFTLQQRSKNVPLLLTELFESFYEIKSPPSLGLQRYTLGGQHESCLQYLPYFRNFLEKRDFEKVKNERSSGGLLAIKNKGHRFIPLPP